MKRAVWVQDAGLAALLALADAPGATGGWAWFAAIHLPLVLRRRFPVAVFWTGFALAVTAWVVGGIEAVYPFVALLAALATVAWHRSWRWWSPAVAAIAAVLVTGRLQGALRDSDLVALAAALAAAVLLGVAVRTRRAYVAEVERRAAAAERTRIAREVHDVVAHNLAVMVALADGAALTAVANPERAAGALGTIAATGREALDEMHRLLDLLRDAPMDLDALVDQVRAAGLRVEVVREGTPGRWGAEAGPTVYRVVQEALTNTLRHAGPAARVRVHVRYETGALALEITDDGGAARKARSAPSAGGRGLAGMRERVAAHDGHLEAGPFRNGWRVRATLHFGQPGWPCGCCSPTTRRCCAWVSAWRWSPSRTWRWSARRATAPRRWR
ncbi:sensor histidine kinase [Dactylosporangium sp. CS-047395]|uniref:sensor histidine kinase n=1 Tax=Dactylosporangium sp. CS-047395 TaxID=3239936 RepID=UPI003D8D4242